MKLFMILIAVMSIAMDARADLVMHEQADFGNPTNLISITIKIHGDKIRQDLYGATSGDMSLIKDAATGDSIVLMRSQKLFTKPPKKTEDAKSPDAALSAPRNTGSVDSVGGYDTQIYAWAADRKLWNDTNGMIETLWVAKNYPDFDIIKSDLAKLDRANVSFPGKGMSPAVSTLPGMVVKSRLNVKMGEAVQTVNIMLLSAKEELVEPSTFEIPPDYTEWNPPGAQPTPTNAANK